MKQSEILSYLYDFVSMLIEQDNLKESVDRIILFGSVARGDSYDESDIDIFVDVRESKNTKRVEVLCRDVLNRFEISAEKTWRLRGIDLPIKIIVGRLSEPVWEDLGREIENYGILLYSMFGGERSITGNIANPESSESLVPYALASYSLGKLSQNKKMRFLRELFGYTDKKKKKVYEREGLLSQIGGDKTAPTQIMIKYDSLSKVLDVFRSFKVPYEVRKVWM